MHAQLAVLGGGPGGYAAAFLAADKGMEVALVEADQRLGGTCLLRGCIPSKALLHVARVMSEVDELQADWGVQYGPPQIDLAKVRARKEKVIATLAGGLQQLAKRRRVRLINARGVFQDSQTLRLYGENGALPPERELTFEHAILACGSAPSMPVNFAIGSQRVMDSTAALNLPEVPQSLLVIGGGYIGLEMGTVYAKLGSQVTVVEMTDGLLPGVDRDLVKPLHTRLKTLLQDRVILNTKIGALGDRGDSIEIAFEGPSKFGVERFDRVLVAIGRRPATGEIGLENTQVQLDPAGFAVCDSKRRTADPHILAVGDVAGEPMLAHKATHEAKVAVEALLGEPAEFDKLAVPAVVFTDPEVAWAGLTQGQAEREGRAVEAACYPWGASGRAHALGRVDGLTKWILDPASSRVLGCGIVGPGAGELIAEAVLAIEMGCHVRDVAESVHPHPTLSETLMNAAELHLGFATEIYKPKR